VIEGTAAPEVSETAVWTEYEFKGKPGKLSRVPPQIAPYHLRLDWLMWFAAMSTPLDHPWFVPLLIKLLENDRPTLKLLRGNPFANAPPTFVRARLYRYRFTTPRERRETGNWWARDLAGDYVPPVRLAREEAASR
jgi:Lipase maturation factor